MTLVVQAHPVKDSYNAALLDAVRATEPDPRVVRLGQGDQLTVADCAAATRLVAIYPTWWGSLPAVLLDAVNSLIGPWIDGSEPANTSPLRSIKHVTVVTSHGSSKFINRLQGEPGLQLWRRSILPLCANRATFRWQSLYGMDETSASERADFVAAIATGSDFD